MKNFNKSNVLFSFEYQMNLEKNVEKIIFKISVQNVPRSIKGIVFLLHNPRVKCI